MIIEVSTYSQVFPNQSSFQPKSRKNRYRVLLLLLLSCFHLTNSFVLEVTWSCYCGYSGSHDAGSRGRSSWGLKIVKGGFKFTGFCFAHLFWNYETEVASIFWTYRISFTSLQVFLLIEGLNIFFKPSISSKICILLRISQLHQNCWITHCLGS